MANSKISALTSATIPLAGTEVLPIVQSGATVKVANNDLRPKQIQSNVTTGVLQIDGPAAAATRVMTVPDANFTAARTDAAQSFTGDQTLSTGNLVQGTAAKGINFTANTASAGSTSQLLNWYEEGSGTATRSGFTEVPGAGTITSTYYYTRIGRAVFMNITLVCAGGAQISWGPSGTAAFTGLPFAAAQYAIGTWLNTTNLSTTGPTAWISTTMYVAGATVGATTNNSFSFSGMFNV